MTMWWLSFADWELMKRRDMIWQRYYIKGWFWTPLIYAVCPEEDDDGQ